MTLHSLDGACQQAFEVEGGIQIGYSETINAELGTIRFNVENNDFEGWTGEWVSLTQTHSPTGNGVVTYVDGNRYLTVTIGTQTWMRENLRTTRYSNGDPIPEIVLNDDWDASTAGAWCWYENDHEKEIPFGKLYNWYAVNDARGLCPDGWHVPTDAEWDILSSFLGGQNVAGGKMKKVGAKYWSTPNTLATNESGFSGIAGGFRNDSGSFANLAYQGGWWSITEVGDQAWFIYLEFDNNDGWRNTSDKSYGLSIRCLKD